MGECLSSASYVYEEESRRSELVIETWDRGHPYEGDEPRINVTATDHVFNLVATSGLEFEQVRALHAVLGRWLDENRPSALSPESNGGTMIAWWAIPPALVVLVVMWRANLLHPDNDDDFGWKD